MSEYQGSADMSDAGLETVAGDVPVNPYSLLEAVNAASNISRSGWVLYLALMAYLLIAVAGVTHQDLLLNSPIKLPIMDVNIVLARFFAFAPLVLLFTHFGMLVQHVMLARKVIAFDESLQPLENNKKPTHPLRLELHSYFFTQALAGPQRSWLFGFFLHAMIWLSLVVLPVFLILYIQVVFLPFHHESVTWGHRVVLVMDVALLFFIGIFLRRADVSFFHALVRVVRHNPLSFIITSLIFAAVMLFSFFVATVPDKFLDRLSRSLPGAAQKEFQKDDAGNRHYFGYAVPFLYGSTEGTREALFGLFHRNLIVRDLDLVLDRNVTEGEISINLRNRDLRNAKLDRSDLHQADLTGADLTDASLIKTDLRGALITCVDLDRLRLEKNREKAECALLRSANLSGAKLNSAQLQGADFTASILEEANLSNSNATYAVFTGANFFSAEMQKIDLSAGADLMGANLLGAQLQGAKMTGVRLQGADLSGAGLQGAMMAYAQLHGANLLGAELQGANLSSAILYGADLSDTVLTGANLSKARIWMTKPSSLEAFKLADLSDIQIAPPRGSEIDELQGRINSVSHLDQGVKDQIIASLSNLMKQVERDRWNNSAEKSRWRALASSRSASGVDGTSGSRYGERLTRYLAGLMCSSKWRDGSVTEGIAARATNQAFKGNAASLLEALKRPDCSVAKTMDEELLQRLSNKVQSAGVAQP